MDTMTRVERRKVRVVARYKLEQQASERARKRRGAGLWAGIACYLGKWIVYVPRN